jgi:RNA polymerase sigma factor (sigma-70 family)
MTDAELIKAFADNSQRKLAFNQLVRKYQQKIYWHIRKMVLDHDDANDLTQDTFVKAWQNIENFRGDSQLYTWLYRIATNETLNFLQKKKKRFAVSMDDEESGLPDLADTLENDVLISGDEIQLKLQKAILTLPDKQRLVFNMRYFDEMKYEEISDITDTSVGALKASYHLAVEKIEKYLNQQ